MTASLFKSPGLVSILDDLNNAIVWMTSTRPHISKSSSPCISPLVTVTIIIVITMIIYVCLYVYVCVCARACIYIYINKRVCCIFRYRVLNINNRAYILKFGERRH